MFSFIFISLEDLNFETMKQRKNSTAEACVCVCTHVHILMNAHIYMDLVPLGGLVRKTH